MIDKFSGPYMTDNLNLDFAMFSQVDNKWRDILYVEWITGNFIIAETCA